MFKAGLSEKMLSVFYFILALTGLACLLFFFNQPVEQVEVVPLKELLSEEEFARYKKQIEELYEAERQNIDTWFYLLTGLFALGTLVIAGFAIALPLFGMRFAEQSRAEMQRMEGNAKEILKEIKGYKKTAEELTLDMRSAEDVDGNPEDVEESLEKIQSNPEATVFEKAVAKALSLQQEKKYEEAKVKWLAIANLAEDTFPDIAANAWFSVGYLWQEYLGNTLKEKNEEAIKAYDKTAAINADISSLFNNRGNAKFRLGNNDGALADYNESIRLDPNNSHAFNGRGNIKSLKEDYDEAFSDYKESIRLNPNNPHPFIGSGNIKRIKEDFDGALSDCNEAIRLNPNISNAFNGRAVVKMSMGDLDGALADFDEAIRLDSSNSATFDGRGNVKRRIGDLTGAIADYDSAILLDPNNSHHFNGRGTAKEDNGDLEEALADFNESIRLDPDNSDAFNNRGHLRALHDDSGEAIGAFDEAMKDFDKSINVKPSAYNHQNRGALWSRLGQDKNADTDFESMRELLPVSGYLRRWFVAGLKDDLRIEQENRQNAAVISFIERCIEEVEKLL